MKSKPWKGPFYWLHPNGYGTLGYALPAAIGAKLGAPARPVVALVGDAGLLFTVQELATAVDEGLCLPILLWNNDGLGQRHLAVLDLAVLPEAKALALAAIGEHHEEALAATITDAQT